LATFADALTNRLSTRIFSVSESITDYLKRQERIPEERIVFLPNSVDRAVFRPSDDQRRKHARDVFGIPVGAKVVGAVGRMVPQKDFKTFVLAALELNRMRPDLVYVMFGSGPEEEMLRKLASPLGESFRFAGAVSDRPAIYAAIDALVLPSRFEGLPMTILEAMASGVPVIASNVDGIREISTHGREAALIAPGDVPAFVQAIDRITRGGYEVHQQIAAAEALMAERFDAIRLSREMHSWYEKDVKHQSLP
jgi:glycosyltransferase involved in cell wall biosynthesis